LTAQRKGKSGRKKMPAEEVREKISRLRPRDMTNLRTIASKAGLSTNMVYRRKDELQLNRATSWVKPCLTPDNEKRRLEWALEHVEGPNPDDPETMMFGDMKRIIHIDEKWFFLKAVKKSYWVMDGKQPPVRKVQHKNHIPQVIFLAAVARPRYDFEKEEMWDGKVFVGPIVEIEQAKRRSCNRDRGAYKTVPLTMTKDVYKRYIIEKIIPAIKEKWPPSQKEGTIWIQQDDASPHHIANDDDVIAAGVAGDGWEIRLKFQPPNSPQCNVLDLGFFNSIQKLQHEQDANNIDELIKAVVEAWDREKHRVLNNIFLTLQDVLRCIIEHRGRNDFPLPHMGKARLERQGLLPERLSLSRTLYEDA
ncbi:unnamed protein product, partial [Chrysoparadoxa australica]